LNCKDAREEGYSPALARALEALSSLDLRERAAVCGGRLSDDGSAVSIGYFGEDYIISSAGDIAGPEGDVPVFTRLILLHYLAGSRGTRPAGHIVTFREVPDGNFYFHSFQDRVVKPVLAAFGEKPDLLRERGKALGWRGEGEGDVCLETSALPLVPIRVMLWCGDEELSPEASVLFDSSVSDHLHTEDIALVAEEAVRLLTEGSRDG
jgi:hypothetical protein